MKRLRVRDLPNWPPEPGGPNPGGRYKIPNSEQALMTALSPRQRPQWVTFTSSFDDLQHTHDFEASNEELAEQLRRLIANNVGKSVFAIGDLEIEI
jgi:hypothetical protein